MSVQLRARRIAHIEDLGGGVQEGPALFQEIHSDDAVDGAAGAVPEGTADGFERGHGDLEFADLKLTEDDFPEDCGTDGGAVTGGIDDLGARGDGGNAEALHGFGGHHGHLRPGVDYPGQKFALIAASDEEVGKAAGKRG